MDKTNKIEHTPAPWTYKYGSVYYGDTESRLLLADRNNPDTAPVERDANLRRVVACVNACHDIEDPDAAHAVARDAIRAAFDYLDGLEVFNLLGPGERLRIARRLAHLSEAHALLGGGPL